LEVVMRIPKPVLGGFLVLILLAAGAYLVFFNKAPAAPGAQAAGASAAFDAGQSADQQAGQKPAAAPLPVKAVMRTLKAPQQLQGTKWCSSRKIDLTPEILRTSQIIRGPF
jgi:hypothetical protein